MFHSAVNCKVLRRLFAFVHPFESTAVPNCPRHVYQTDGVADLRKPAPNGRWDAHSDIQSRTPVSLQCELATHGFAGRSSDTACQLHFFDRYSKSASQLDRLTSPCEENDAVRRLGTSPIIW